MTESMATTRPNIQALRERPHAEVLIIGGGINGIATFRDLALQGVDVALVERDDYVSGASSASSHMVHGGVRYLENGEFRLVRESVTERNRLVRNAPHFVRPLPTTIPIHRTISGILTAPFRLLVTHGRGKPRERGALLIKLGLVMYDTFSRDGGAVPRHRFHGRRRSRELFPDLDDRFRYTATYYDASMHDPERLALDVLRDGTREESARAANYAPVVGADGSAVIIRDALTGDEFPFTADVIVNTSGPWTDITNSALGAPTRFMGGTKGSHIVLDNPALLEATRGNEIFFEAADGRIVLIYPLKGRVMVGTTDIDADPAQPTVCTDEEIEYFFDLIGQVFPRIAVDRSQIVYTFSGIRPLPRHDDVAPGFVSRDYRIERARLGAVPVLSLVGGKWTTFRALAEHLSDDVMTALGRTRRISTLDLPIGGGAGYPRTEADRARWLDAHRGAHTSAFADRMLERYGTYASEVLGTLPVAQRPLEHAPGYSAEEIAFLAGREEVVSLIDLLLRRTHIAFVGGVGMETLTEVAEAAAPALGWDDEAVRAQVDEAARVLQERHRIDVRTSHLAPSGR
ncbi:glycerol-3-phosphate dehydrogenase/oxidase [Microbacterium hominis]|uniref:glycerol-3-phosphate dehydrogenase/oxidase n=1 Tax=Microbacterium TaxID=33882 RepID=UPI00168B1B95|nr:MULTISPECIES: glycerol-3-phosphate dehydrogenase/oxidase [Microbacterium]QOC27121.1 glycerol-3-phosphate dehydrogenase/oxidase [Microbacterium hominis]QOC28275.1 glycerol-3-phosphate dehydrogenase/oxidase [Microbacterium hominis]QYF96542.1 glycerol-3-phosphate dehydrogenase/oxidase [Microbacterium sp. PAMC21962]